MLDGCKHVYLDVGANIGLQVRKLFEPERFPGALIQPVFDRYFGADVARRRAEVCAVGFEPNLDLTSRLAELGERYTRLGWRTSFLKAAASTRDGNVTFYRDVSFVGARNNQWGASMFASSFNQALGARAHRAAMTVPTIDLAEWMLAEVVNRRLPPEASSSESVQRPRVVMKLDIEGSEYVVLPHLLSKRVLKTARVAGRSSCPNCVLCSIDYMYMEVHPGAPGFDANLIGAAQNATRECGLEVTTLDDEVPLDPTSPYCRHLAASATGLAATGKAAWYEVRANLRANCYPVPPLPSV